jgi:hypothetical protein
MTWSATRRISGSPELRAPILEIVPLQMLAYCIAVRRGCNVDQSRNLAKERHRRSSRHPDWYGRIGGDHHVEFSLIVQEIATLGIRG